MERESIHRALVPIALLGLSVGAYFLVLLGVVPLRQEPGVILTIIAGLTAISAVIIRAKIPAVTAGIATVGFGLGAANSVGAISMNGLAVTVGSVLAILGGLGFLISTIHLVGTRVYQASPT